MLCVYISINVRINKVKLNNKTVLNKNGVNLIWAKIIFHIDKWLRWEMEDLIFPCQHYQKRTQTTLFCDPLPPYQKSTLKMFIFENTSQNCNAP